MRTVTFKSIIDGSLARIGLDPTITPPANTLAAFTEYVNSSVRVAWEMYPWPDFMRFEQRQFYPDWSSSTNYAAGSGVLGSDGVYYFAVQSSTNVNPTTDTTDTYWQNEATYAVTIGNGIIHAIDLDQVGKTPIGEVIAVYTADPRVNRYAPRVNWWLTGDGIVVGQNSTAIAAVPNKIWVQFTVRPTIYSTTSYSNGDAVPYVLSEAVKHLVCGAAQREDGQYDKAAAMEQLAESCLQVEWDKLEMKQQQQGRFHALNR
jgi:hypothetical protein